MEELQQQIVDLQNQVTNALALISKNQYSNNTITQKDIVMQNGSYGSANFVTGVSGWQFDAEGNLEANNGTFRGTIVIGGQYRTVSSAADIQTALDAVNTAGGGTVVLENGTYTMSSDITLYSSTSLQGQNANGAIIDFNGGAYQIKVVGSGAYSTGTVSVSNNGTAVTGSGTTWTGNVTAGQYIMLGGLWYPITVVGGNTSITIGVPYAGKALSGATYVAATRITDVKVLNLTVKNSATAALKLQYADEFYCQDVEFQTSASAIDADDSNQINLIALDAVACNSGYDLNNVHYSIMRDSGSVDAQVGVGMTLTGVTNSAFKSNFILNSAGDGVNMTSCSNMQFDGAFVENAGQGLELISGNTDIFIQQSAFQNNGSDGVKFTATSDNIFIVGATIKDNGGYGLNIAASSCDGNVLTSSVFSGNSSGQVNDSGTGTLIRGNVGVNDNATSGSGIISRTFTAGESLSPNDSVYIAPAAIVFDASSTAVNPTRGATSETWSHTVGNGANRYLTVFICRNDDTTTAADDVTGVTYNGVAMTQLHKANGNANGRFAYGYIYGLANPASGANNVVVSLTGSTGSRAYCTSHSYTGVKQTAQPDATASATANNVTVSTNITTVADGAWVVAVALDQGPYTGGGVLTARADNASGNTETSLDSNGSVGAAGSKSISATCASAGNTIVAVSLAPVTTVGIYKTYATTTTTSGSFIGFANAAYSANDSAVVNIGGVIGGFSGLSVGSQYYLSNSAGAIALSAGSVTRKVGIATSTTELLITNIW